MKMLPEMNYREKCEMLRSQAMQLAAFKGLTVDEFIRDELEFDPIAAKGRDLKRKEPLYLAHDAYADTIHVSSGIDMALRGIRERAAMRLLEGFVGRAKIIDVDGKKRLVVDGITDEEKSLRDSIITDLQRLLQRDDICEMFKEDADGEKWQCLPDDRGWQSGDF